MKSGLEYFPLDVHLDEKFELIEAEFGLTGFSIVVKLYQRIYGGQGYYCEWTNEVALLFGRACGLGGNAVSEIVKAAIKRGIFDKDMFEKYQILTSAGIQKRYFEAVVRRKQIEVKSVYLLLCNTQIPNNVHILSENANISFKNDHIPKESKVEESRVKESKGKESKEESAKAPLFLPFSSSLNNAVLRWFDYKEESKDSMSATSKSVLIDKIQSKLEARHRERDIIELINLCIERKWKGIIWDRLPPPNNSSFDIDELEKFINRF